MGKVGNNKCKILFFLHNCFFFIINRPPGHHSMRSAANGFCVFNNVAIAAQYAKQKYGVQR